MNFFSTGDAPQAHAVKMAVYAPAGGGKTLLNATLPRPILLSAEAGTLSLSPQNIAKVYGPNRADICYDLKGIVITNLADLRAAYGFCTTSPYMKDFDSIGLDSASEIAERVLAAELKNNKDGRKAYGAMNETITEELRKFRDIPNKHVYFSFKIDREATSDGTATRSGPGMPGKTLTQGVAYFFDEVFSLEISARQPDGTTFRYLRTALDLNYYAKDRSGALAEYEEPHLGKVITKIQNYVKRS